jgi:hypothetical protein
MLTRDRVIRICLADRISPRVSRRDSHRRSFLTSRRMGRDARTCLVEETPQPSQAASESNMLPSYAARLYAAGAT